MAAGKGAPRTNGTGRRAVLSFGGFDFKLNLEMLSWNVIVLTQIPMLTSWDTLPPESSAVSFSFCNQLQYTVT